MKPDMMTSGVVVGTIAIGVLLVLAIAAVMFVQPEQLQTRRRLAPAKYQCICNCKLDNGALLCAVVRDVAKGCLDVEYEFADAGSEQKCRDANEGNKCRGYQDDNILGTGRIAYCQRIAVTGK